MHAPSAPPASARRSRQSEPWRSGRPPAAMHRVARLVGVAALSLLVACTSPGPVTVDGRVVGSYGVGVPDLAVVVEGHALTTTDAEGRFRVDGVTLPFDVVVASPSDAWVHAFLGVSDASPELVPEPAQELTPIGTRSTNLTASLPSPVPPGQLAVVCVHGSDVAVRSTCREIVAGNQSAVLSVTWVGSAEITVTVRLVHYRIQPDGTSSDVVAAVSVVRTVRDGVAASDTLTPTSVTSATLASDHVVPVGFGPVEVLLATMAEGDVSFQRVPYASARPPGPVPVPAESGMRYLTAAWASGASGESSYAWQVDLPPDAAVTNVLANAVVLEAPADGAVDVAPDTLFRFAPTVPATHTVVARPATFGAGPTFAVSTLAGEARLPDIAGDDPSLAPLAWPSGTAYVWSVHSFAEEGRPVSVPRAMIGRLRTSDLGCRCGFAPERDGSYTRSGANGFTLE